MLVLKSYTCMEEQPLAVATYGPYTHTKAHKQIIGWARARASGTTLLLPPVRTLKVRHKSLINSAWKRWPVCRAVRLIAATNALPVTQSASSHSGATKSIDYFPLPWCNGIYSGSCEMLGGDCSGVCQWIYCYLARRGSLIYIVAYYMQGSNSKQTNQKPNIKSNKTNSKMKINENITLHTERCMNVGVTHTHSQRNPFSRACLPQPYIFSQSPEK